MQTEILYKDLSSFEDDVSAFSLGLRHSQDRYLQLVRDLATRVREAREESVPPPAPTPQPPCDTRNMRKAVKSILSTQVNNAWCLQSPTINYYQIIKTLFTRMKFGVYYEKTAG